LVGRAWVGASIAIQYRRLHRHLTPQLCCGRSYQYDEDADRLRNRLGAQPPCLERPTAAAFVSARIEWEARKRPWRSAWAGARLLRTTQRLDRDLDRPARVPARIEGPNAKAGGWADELSGQ